MSTPTMTYQGNALQAIASALIPANAAQIIEMNARSGKRPSPAPRPVAMHGLEVMDRGSCCYAVGNLSIVCIDGVMEHTENPFSWLFGGTSTATLTQAIRDAADDPLTKAILFRVNSPGGDVAGMSDLAAAVAYAKAKKPVHAISESVCGSAAFWAVCGSAEIVLTPTSLLGSVGVFVGPIIDQSKALAAEGIEVFNAKTGENKGAGMLGVPLSDGIKGEYQRIADTLGAEFFNAVAAGRNKSTDEIKGLQGRVFAGADAVSAGLADRVVPSVEAYIAELQNKFASGRAAAPGARASASSPKAAAQGVSAMATDWSNVTDDDLKTMPASMVEKIKGMYPEKQPDQEPAASSAQLKTAGIPDALRLKALEEGMTLTQALAAKSAAIEAENEKLKASVADLTEKVNAKTKATASVTAAAGNLGGVAPIATATATDSGLTEYEQLIRAEMATNGSNRFRAIHTVNMKRPDLYRAWHAEQVAASKK